MTPTVRISRSAPRQQWSRYVWPLIETPISGHAMQQIQPGFRSHCYTTVAQQGTPIRPRKRVDGCRVQPLMGSARSTRRCSSYLVHRNGPEVLGSSRHHGRPAERPPSPKLDFRIFEWPGRWDTSTQQRPVLPRWSPSSHLVPQMAPAVHPHSPSPRKPSSTRSSSLARSSIHPSLVRT
jgi:hypothetical protein